FAAVEETTLTVGAVTSHVTVLSVLVEAVFGLATESCATPAAMVAITVPVVVMPATATLYGPAPEPDVTVAVFVPPALPLTVTSPVAKSDTGLLKTTVKLIGPVFTGSLCPAAWLMVTVGAIPSTCTPLVTGGEMVRVASFPAVSFIVPPIFK